MSLIKCVKQYRF